jgi:hypothetical protein
MGHVVKIYCFQEMICKRIKETIVPGTIIPKPRSTRPYCFMYWGKSRGEEAFVYGIPTKPGTNKSSTKRIPCSVFEEAYKVLQTGEITKRWFVKTFPKVNKDGGCDFTTLGGVFQLLGLAEWSKEGVYRRLSLRGQHPLSVPR